jgi:putative MATE family efflux protein
VTDLAREVRRLAFPAILHSLLQTLVFVVDRIMLGRYSDASLAAMQVGGAFEWSIWSVFAAFEVGTIARIGRHIGAGKKEEARQVALLSMTLAVVVGVVLAMATPLVLALIPLSGSRMSAAALAEARGYLGTTILASPLVFVGTAATATLQASGDTRTPLAIGIVANVIHIGMNRVLILGAFGIPAMGAHGAGISLAITFALEAGLAVAALMRRDRPVSLRRSTDTPRSITARDEVRELVHIGGPAFAERVLYHIGFITYALMVTRLGDSAMAANQSLISVESICFLSADGFGIAAAALVAQKLGAKRPDDARRAAWIATRYSVIALTVFGLVALGLRDLIMPAFTKDGHVIAIGRNVFWVLAVAQPFMGAGIVLAQSLRGAGRTREALLVSIVGAVVVRLTATYVFGIALGFGLVGIWMGSTVDWIVRSALLGLRQRSFPRVRESAPEP